MAIGQRESFSSMYLSGQIRTFSDIQNENSGCRKELRRTRRHEGNDPEFPSDLSLYTVRVTVQVSITIYLELIGILLESGSDGSGTEKVGFGRVREFPKFERSCSGLSGIEKTRVMAGIFWFGNSRTHH